MEIFSDKRFEKFFNAVASLKSKDEVRKFFEDVCTIKEIEDMAQRLEVAELLTMGSNYQEVVKSTGASTATISRVNKCINYGAGGYKLVLNKDGDK